MRKKMHAIGVAALSGLLVSVACSSSNPGGNSGAGGASGGTPAGGGGVAGSISRGGQGGHGGMSTTHGGGGNSAGTTSKAGTGGSQEAGTGGEAGATSQCPECATGFCFLDKTCVECLPSLDNCPEGTVCGSTNKCVPGCKADGTSCASGVCADAQDCQNCIGDAECGGGHLCGDNHCAAACTAEQEGTSAGCGAGLTCCGLHCVAANTDSQNCGACGVACAAGQFCGLEPGGGGGSGGASGGASGGPTSLGVACHDTTLAHICAVPKVAVVLDGQDGNQIPGRAMAQALVDHCLPAPASREVSQTVPDALNPASGRPVSGAHELLVAAGGSIFARLLGYLDSEKISPIYWHYDQVSTIQFRKSATDEAVVTRDTGESNDDHDFFVIQFVRDPVSGSLVLNAEGFWESGTVAAAFFFANGILPDPAAFDKSWYVYEWTDKNGDKAPDLDEMKMVASGS